MSLVIFLVGMSGLFWFVMFSPWIASPINFWFLMFVATGLLGGFGIALQRKKLAELYFFKPQFVAIGTVAGASLYAIFFAGEILSTMLFDFAGAEISKVYTTRQMASPLVIGALLMFWIGPAEEIFWRGFVQQEFAANYGAVFGYFVSSLLYAGIHVFALNFMLLMASLICGLFWGALFLKYKSVWPGIISHALWDVAIFVVFPMSKN
ncbi:MAG: lysostaphin resistance A-like protein [Desulfomonilaceae bacterium]